MCDDPQKSSNWYSCPLQNSTFLHKILIELILIRLNVRERFLITTMYAIWQNLIDITKKLCNFTYFFDISFSGTGMKSSPSLVNVAGHGQPIKREDTIDFSQLSDLPPFVHDISTYYHKFEKLHLIVNNGVHGTVFSVQRTSVPQLSVGQGSFGGKVSRT